MSESLTAPAPSSPAVEKIRSRMLNPFLMRGFMLAKLPLALVAGLRVREMTRDALRGDGALRLADHEPVPVDLLRGAQHGGRDVHRARSALMAVELAPQPVAMLIVSLEASFGKKATATDGLHLRGRGEALRRRGGDAPHGRGGHGAAGDGGADGGRHRGGPLRLHLVVQEAVEGRRRITDADRPRPALRRPRPRRQSRPGSRRP